VKHAIALSSRKVTLTLSAREEAGRLVITVADDGRPSETAGKASAGHSIGLTNVRERLAARFGTEASVVSGHTGSGYSTRISIPLVKHG